MPHYQVLFEKRALKKLKKLSFKIQEKILEALRILRDEGFSPKLNIKKLKGYTNHYRIKIGKYRILFELEPKNIIRIYAILPRKKHTNNTHKYFKPTKKFIKLK